MKMSDLKRERAIQINLDRLTLSKKNKNKNKILKKGRLQKNSYTMNGPVNKILKMWILKKK